jgi:hypothetical protein
LFSREELWVESVPVPSFQVPVHVDCPIAFMNASGYMLAPRLYAQFLPTAYNAIGDTFMFRTLGSFSFQPYLPIYIAGSVSPLIMISNIAVVVLCGTLTPLSTLGPIAKCHPASTKRRIVIVSYSEDSRGAISPFATNHVVTLSLYQFY